MAALALLEQLAQPAAAAAALDIGLCEIGRCINCFYCDGTCFDNCKCYSDINTCCCVAPPGHYARGYGKVPCPGGTYSDRKGAMKCKPCNTSDSDQKYNLNKRGAIDLMDCVENQCADSGDWCDTSEAVLSKMSQYPKNDQFCSNFSDPIGVKDCSFIEPDYGFASRRASSCSAVATVALLLAISGAKSRAAT